MEFNIVEHKAKGITVIQTPPHFNIDNSKEFRDLLAELVEDKKFNIVLDLSKTKYIDSSGLGAIVSKIAVLRSNNGDIKLAVPSELVMELLEITQLNRILNTFDKVEDAVSRF